MLQHSCKFLMAKKEEVDLLISDLTEKTRIKINRALKWARKYDITKKEYNSRQIACLVILYESAEPNFSWEIGEILHNMDTAEKHLLVSWLRETFSFEKQNVYDLFKTWMKNKSNLGFYIAFDMNRTYGILQEAACKGDNDLLKWLLSRNVEIDSRDDLGNTALHMAAAEGHLATVKFLLDHKASIFVLNSERRRPFDLALNSEQFDICDILYPMPTQKSFESMILDFVREGNVRKLQYLLKKNEWCYIWSALSVAVEKRYPKLVDMLLQNCLRLSLVPNEHNTIILTKAISNGDRIIVEKLLAAGFEMEDSLISLAMENNLYEFLNNCDHKSIIDTVD